VLIFITPHILKAQAALQAEPAAAATNAPAEVTAPARKEASGTTPGKQP